MVARLRDIRLHAYDLPLRAAWSISSGKTARRRGWVVEIIDGDGVHGLGDCPADVPGHPALATERSALDESCRAAFGFSSIEDMPQPLGPDCAAAAVECALLDIAARKRSLPLCRLLDHWARSRVEINAVARLDSFDQLPITGFRVIKLKVGSAPVEDDLAALRAFPLSPGVRLRLDANRAWTYGQAQRFLDGLDGLPVDSVEEPLAETSLDGLARLQARTPVALAMDESLTAFPADEILSARAVRRLVLKLGAIGGHRATRAFALAARSAGMECVVTSRVDSAVGVAAAAHLAASLDAGAGTVALAHGLATSGWMASDMGVPLPVEDGTMILAGCMGLGVTLP